MREQESEGKRTGAVGRAREGEKDRRQIDRVRNGERARKRERMGGREGKGAREHGDEARRFISIILYFSQT